MRGRRGTELSTLISLIAAALIFPCTVCGGGLQLIGSLVDGAVRSVDLTDDYAYVGGTGVIWVVDITDLDSLRKLSIHHVTYSARDICVQGGLAYVAAGKEGLKIVDVSDPGSPVDAGSIDTPGDALEVSVSGDYAYVADYTGGVRIIDVSNPHSPVEVGAIDTGIRTANLFVSGRYLYAASGKYLTTVDIQNSPAVRVLGILALPMGVTEDHDLFVSGAYAYVTTDVYFDRYTPPTPCLRIVDVGDPENPRLVGDFSDDTFFPISSIYVSGNRAYIGLFNMFGVLDLSRAPPVMISMREFPWYVGEIEVRGDRALITSGQAGLRVVDVSNPADVQEVSSLSTLADIGNVYVSGDYAYVGGFGGLRIVDVRNPCAPKQVGTVHTSGPALHSCRLGDYLYVIDGGSPSGLRVVDISDPMRPEIVGRVDTKQSAKKVYVSGDYAYVLDWSGYYGTLRIIDVSDPHAPTVVASTARDEINVPFDIHVVDDYAYITDKQWYDTGDFRVVNVGNPLVPTLVAAVTTPGYSRAIHINGNYAYQADARGGLNIIDVSEPEFPAITGRYDDNLGKYVDVYAACQYAYVADQNYGLRVIDVSDPSFPQAADSIETPGKRAAVYVSGGLVYLADRGLLIFKHGQSISGCVKDRAGLGIPNVHIDLAGSVEASAWTDENGYYQFTGLDPGTYTVTPFKAGWYFLPPLRHYVDLYEDQAQQDFIGHRHQYLISGRVVEGDGEPVDDVVMILSGDAAASDTTDAFGHYEFEGLLGGTYTVTPSRLCWNFTPASRTYPDLEGDHVDQDFVGEDMPPDLSVSVLQNPFITNHLDVYVVASEAIVDTSLHCSVAGDEIAMTITDPDEYVYRGDYDLYSTGSLSIDVFARDLGFNRGYASRTFSCALIFAASGGTAISSDGRVQIHLGSGTIQRDAYVLIFELEEDPVGNSLAYQISPTELQLNDLVEVAIAYPLDTGEPERYCIARLQGGRATPVNSYVDRTNGTIVSYVDRLGSYCLVQTSTALTPDLGNGELIVLQNAPNPFAGRTIITFDVPKGGRVRAEVISANGRITKTLVNDRFGPGRHSISWNGTDEYGRGVASGVYLYRFRCNSRTITKKMVHLR
jgi:hypothetical protein